MTDKQHARLAPSSSERWIRCPGSVALCDKVPPAPQSDYALEGTVAHEVGFLCLTENKEAESFIGHVIQNWTVTEEMTDHVQTYVDAIRDYRFEFPTAICTYEQTIDVSWIHPDIGGTPDFNMYVPDKRLVRVVDYKHGQGVAVSPEKNSQIMIYALGVVHDLYVRGIITNIKKDVNMVELIIIQPRIFGEEPIKTWSIHISDLMFWATQILQPAAHATEAEGAPLHVGKHCYFCPAQAVCPEQVNNAMAIAKTTYSDPVLPSPEDVSPEDVLKLLHLSTIFNEWVGKVKLYIEAQMNMGIQYPGLKLVKKRSKRRWVDVEQAKQALKSVLSEEECYKKTFLTMPQIEKLLKKKGLISESVLSGLYEQPDNGVTVAEITDKRAEVAAPALMDFIDTADFMQ